MMALRSGFFNSVSGDRKYDASFFAEYFATFIGNGVFPNPSTGLQVITNNDMTITVKAGKAWINGYYFVNDANHVLSLDGADGVLKRIDRIVLRLDFSAREITLVIKKSPFASSPVAPVLQRDADAYELALADILVNNGATSISQGNISDQRLNTSLCGVVHGVVDQVDTTTIFNQYQAWFNDITSGTEQEIDQWQQGKEQDFADWFVSIQNLLDGDVATNLANQILQLQAEINEAAFVNVPSTTQKAKVKLIEGVMPLINQSINTFNSQSSIFSDNNYVICSDGATAKFYAKNLTNFKSKSYSSNTENTAICADDNYYYIARSSVVRKHDKTTLEEVGVFSISGYTSSFPLFDIWGPYLLVYTMTTTNTNQNYLKFYNKETGVKDFELAMSQRLSQIVIDGNFLYASNQISGYFIEKYSFTTNVINLIATTPNIERSIEDFVIDDNYLYILENTSVKKYNKDDLTLTNTLDLSSLFEKGSTFDFLGGLTIDNQYVYIGSRFGVVLKFDKTNFELLGKTNAFVSSGMASGNVYGYKIDKIVVNDDYIYSTASGFPINMHSKQQYKLDYEIINE